VLDIVIDDGLSDIVAGRFDAGIRIGERLRLPRSCGLAMQR
jgi:DNA-binding transcriptional LysR family regulator